jgi:serine/threonine-protein kinase
VKGKQLALNQLVAERYRIKSFIGQGGMQEVYASHDERLDRAVAIKVPLNTSSERRFKQSAVLSARVNHPNAAKTLDYLEEGEQFFLVEELILGEDLSKATERLTKADPYLAAHVLHNLAKGVAASHHAGVVHRDLKPSNILVSPNLTFETIKVTDFGIAKMAEAEIVDAVEGGEETITKSSTVFGALPYLSPEMVETPKKAGAPADVWALGAMAYELLTGVKPFGKGLKAVNAILNAPVPPLPAWIAAHLQFAELANAVFKVVTACLEKSADSRPSADDLVAMCESLCYLQATRSIGEVVERQSTTGRIHCDGAVVFFHVASAYGQAPKKGDKVLFLRYPGKPNPRAHPVVVITSDDPPSL